MKNSTACLLAILAPSLLAACGFMPAESENTSADTEDDDGTDSMSSVTTPTSSPSTTLTTATDPSTSSGMTEPTTGDTESSSSDPSDTETDATGSGSSDGSSSGSGSSSTGDTTGGAGDSIYEIQDGTIGEGVDVDVQGVIVTGLRDQVGMFVQEPGGGEYSGVYVDSGDIDLSGLAVGDEVDITGVTSEGSAGLTDLTAIDASAGTVVATGNTGLEPDPELVPLSALAPDAAEPWEGVLVMVEEASNVVVTDEPGFDEFQIEFDGSSVLVDNFLYVVYDNAATFPNFAVGAEFESVTGPLNYTFDAFKIAPRSAADLAGYLEPQP